MTYCLALGDGTNLATVTRLYEAALYMGRLSQEVAARHRGADGAVGADGTATFIVELDELRIEEASPYLAQIQGVWSKHMLDAIADLPRLQPDGR